MDLYNTLTKKKEEFIPVNKGKAGIYSCGPTVYWNQHIGHMYAYVQWDVLVRFLRYMGYNVRWVMNITDVGHMTSDEDVGEDKMEKGAKREGVSVNQIAEKYIRQFLRSMDLLNIQRPDVLCRATEHVDQQIELIKKIEANGFTYKTKMGLVFNTQKFKNYKKFANLKLSKMRKTFRQEDDPEKKFSWDFYLWVTGRPEHMMQWESPWGYGFPGWHIECTAMSTHYLGAQFDIHTGGLEHIPVHHTNEIAQGYAAFGAQTANYWMHNAWLMGKGGVKMSKSLGNFVTVQDLVEKGYDPLALRYLILTSHYRKGLNYSEKNLRSAQITLDKLRAQVSFLKSQTQRTTLSQEKDLMIGDYNKRFEGAMSDDLNTPQALAVLWEMFKSSIPSEDKYDLAICFDEVIGLGLKNSETGAIRKTISPLGNVIFSKNPLDESVIGKIDQRNSARAKGDFKLADEVRHELLKKDGFSVKDTVSGTIVSSVRNEKSS